MGPYQTLENELIESGVRPRSFCINRTPIDGDLCILNYGDEIECFYFERGVKYDLQTFTDSEKAIEYFKQWVLSDQTRRVDWDGLVK